MDWKITFYTEAGADNGLRCQDCVSEKTHGNVQAIALADGAGEPDDLTRAGAQCACKTLAELLSECFGELYAMDDEAIRFQVITNINSELSRFCAQHGCKPSQLRSTLLGIAIDHKEGHFLAIHLGDGSISCRRAGRFHMISWPENGINKSYTWLTGEPHAGTHIRVCRGEASDIEKVILKSDGFESDTDDKTGRFFDDISFIQMERCKEAEGGV